MKFPRSLSNGKRALSIGIVSFMLAVGSLCLILAAATMSAYAQTPDDVTSATTSTSSSPGDWTQFLRDNMQRWNPYETVLGVNNVPKLQLAWKAGIGNLNNSFASSPAVANGVIYFGTDLCCVYALNARTGAELWAYGIPGGYNIDSSPAVVNGVVYFVASDLYALNASTGTKLWSFSMGSVENSSPTVINGVVYVSSYPGVGLTSYVYALNASTGVKLWSYTQETTFSSPAVANGVVYVGSTDGTVYALNANTGAKLWSYAAQGDVQSSPAVANGVVYFGSVDHNIYALNAKTGAKLWSYTTQGEVQSSPAVANGVVYIGSQDHTMYALDAGNGNRLWSFTAIYPILASPAVANGVVYFTSNLPTSTVNPESELYALNASTGAKLWTYSFDGVPAVYFGVPTTSTTSSPTIVNGMLYLLAGDSNVYAKDGALYAISLGSADLFLRILPSETTVHQGDLLTYAFPVWNLGPNAADHEVLNTQVPAGTTFDYIRISGTPGLGTCTHPPYGGAGQIVCHENATMTSNTTWTVRLTVKVTAPAGTVITANAATMSDTPDPNMVNNTATVSLTVQ